MPRGLASGANVKPAADRRRRGREPRVDWLCTFNRRKWWEKPNVLIVSNVFRRKIDPRIDWWQPFELKTMA